MKGIALCEDEIYDQLAKHLEKEEIVLVKIPSPNEISDFKDELIIVQFPLQDFTRGEIFENLEKLWLKRAPVTVIIKGKDVRVRERDLRENVIIMDVDTPAEEMARKILSKLKSPDVLLVKGLEEYVAKNYQKAYEYWITLAKSRKARGTKVFEYLNIARKEFEEAGLDISELNAILASNVDPYEEGIKLFSTGKMKEAYNFLKKVDEHHPKFLQARALIEKIKEEMELEEAEEVLHEVENHIEIEFSDVFERVKKKPEEDLSPTQAFILSLIDGKTSLKEIFQIMPITEDEFRLAINFLIEKGYIKRRE
ncbi:MAG: hypothetical protein J7L62_05740 [Candidatus Aminicenantes bacterium]|nr:hypothetical protein [Candidatus Aminicenantes bacterium]